MIALAVAVILLSQPVAALPVLSVPYYRSGPVFYLKPMQAADLVIIEMNTSHLTADDTEALAISFAHAPASSPGAITFAPAIAQTSSRAIACDQSYFFRDFTVP